MPITTTSTAFVEARDLVLVLDYCASMDDDSSLVSDLPAAEVNTALDNMWDSAAHCRSEVAGNHDFQVPRHRFRQHQFGRRHQRVEHATPRRF